MNDLKYPMLAKDSRPICKLVVAADYQSAYEVGQYGITRIVPFDEYGEISDVPWFEVWKDTALFARVNSQYVSDVFYQEGQTWTT